MTQIKQIKTDKISEDQNYLRHQRSIPKHWAWVKLGKVAKSFKGKNPEIYLLKGTKYFPHLMLI